MPPFLVQYFCPRQSRFWQGRKTVMNFQIACNLADVLKPNSPLGRARVVDAHGHVVYTV
jgi:hypothetical protein